MRGFIAIVAAIAVCLLASTTRADNLLTNGSFESNGAGWSMPHDRGNSAIFSAGFGDLTPTDGVTMAVLDTGASGWFDDAKLSSWAYQAVDVLPSTPYQFTFDIGNRAAEAVSGLSDAIRDSVTVSVFFDFAALNDDFYPIFLGREPAGSTSQYFALSVIPAGTWLKNQTITFTTPETIPTDVDYGIYKLRPVIMINSTDPNTEAQLLVDNLRLTAAGTGPLPHDGDANNDGAVDVVDLGILARNYDTATGATWVMGDFNKDGAVDVIDLGTLARNYDWTGAPAGSVPEPGSAALIALGGLALLRRFVRHST